MFTHYLYLWILSFASGIFLTTFFGVTLPEITTGIFAGFILMALWFKTLFKNELKGFLWLGIFLVAFSLGALRLELADHTFTDSADQIIFGDKVSIEGLVSVAPDIRKKVALLTVSTETSQILVSVDKYQDIKYGDYVLVSGTLSQPESFETDLGRTFDYPGYLKAKGIYTKIDFATVEVLHSNEGNFIVAGLLRFKQAFMDGLEQVVSEPAAALGEGLLLGVKQALGEELELAFRKTGIIHIVVLSGYNIMLVVLFVMFILGYFLPRKLRAVAGVIAIILFALLVGLSATVLRASIMASLLLIVQATGRVYLVLRGLMIAGAVMILINPYLLVHDVGFQLSFLATLGLIIAAPHLELLFHRLPNIIGSRGFLIATLATQIAVLPLLLYQIGEFSVVAVLVNVLVLPMVPVAMLLTFITGMLAFVSLPLASLAAMPTYLSLQYINNIALWFAGIPFAAFVVPPFPFYLVILAYALLGYLLWRLRHRVSEFGHSELGEKLLRLHSSKEKEELDLKDWIIEEETADEIKNVNTKATKPEVDLAAKETPIFFR